LAVLLVVLAAATLAGCGSENEQTASPGERKLITLDDVGQLRDAFNQDHGSPRLVLVFSPT
jgi:nitrous oxide reductase accessory protein NosL